MSNARRLSTRRAARDGARHATLLGIVDQSVVSLANFATIVVVGKLAGVIALGEYSLAFTVLLLLITLQDSLIASPYSAVCQQLRRGAQRRFAGNLLLIAAIAAVLAALMLFMAGQMMRAVEGVERFTAIARMLALAVPAALGRELVRRMALAHLDVRGALCIDLAASMFQMGTLALLASLGTVTSQGALLSIAVGGCAGVAVGMLIEAREWRVRIRALPRHLLSAIALGTWLCAARLTSIVHSYVVPWLLGAMIGLEAVGGFTAAFGLIAVANPMLMGFVNVMSPQAARAWATGGPRALEALVMRGAIMLTSLTVLVAAPVAIFAKELLSVLYGSQYVTYENVGAVLAFSLVTSIVGTPADHGLRALQRPAGSFVASLCGLAATVLGTLTLVPALGLVGGAHALVIGGAISSAGRWLTFRRLLQRKRDAISGRMTVEPAAQVH